MSSGEELPGIQTLWESVWKHVLEHGTIDRISREPRDWTSPNGKVQAEIRFEEDGFYIRVKVRPGGIAFDPIDEDPTLISQLVFACLADTVRKNREIEIMAEMPGYQAKHSPHVREKVLVATDRRPSFTVVLTHTCFRLGAAIPGDAEQNVFDVKVHQTHTLDEVRQMTRPVSRAARALRSARRSAR